MGCFRIEILSLANAPSFFAAQSVVPVERIAAGSLRGQPPSRKAMARQGGLRTQYPEPSI